MNQYDRFLKTDPEELHTLIATLEFHLDGCNPYEKTEAGIRHIHKIVETLTAARSALEQQARIATSPQTPL